MSALSKAVSPAVREIRLLCCQSSSASAGIRQFIQSSYPAIKQYNPDLPVLIREASGTTARVFVRLEYGVEKHLDLENISAREVEQKISQLLSA